MNASGNFRANKHENHMLNCQNMELVRDTDSMFLFLLVFLLLYTGAKFLV
jgi:hypothetical protein